MRLGPVASAVAQGVGILVGAVLIDRVTGFGRRPEAHYPDIWLLRKPPSTSVGWCENVASLAVARSRPMARRVDGSSGQGGGAGDGAAVDGKTTPRPRSVAFARTWLRGMHPALPDAADPALIVGLRQ